MTHIPQPAGMTGRWRSRRRADPDLRRQAAAIRSMAAAMAAVDERPMPRRRLYSDDDMKARREWARRLKGPAQRMVADQLGHASALGPWRTVTQAPVPAVLDPLHQRFPHCAEVTALVQKHLALCQRAPGRILNLPPLLLVGAPGVGKTVYARQLAELLGTHIVKVAVPALSAGFSLAGLDASYESAKPGHVWEALSMDRISPVVLLDEIDKPPDRDETALGALYELLETHSARTFADQAVLLPIDASYIIWIATCNALSSIEPALLDRFQVVQIEAPTAEQMPAVIESVQADLLAQSDWASGFDHRLSEEVIAALTAMKPRELRRALEDGYASAAASGRYRLHADDVVSPAERRQTKGIGFLS